MEKTVIADKIRQLADSSGIDVLGFAEASEFKDYALCHSQRRDPKLSLPNAKTIIVAGIYIGGLALPFWENDSYGRTSRLYLSGFFLDVIKPLEPIATFLKGEGYQTMVCNSATKEGSLLPLKLAAVRAGLGWQGKHSLLISRKYGTFLALGGIITTADLEHNIKEEPNRCNNCDNCQKACPLEALDQPYVVNMKKCLSYLLQTEHLPLAAQSVMQNRVGDCEICQQACPWNKKHLDNPLSTKLTASFKNKIEDWGKFFYLPSLVELTEKGYSETLGHLNTRIPFNLFRRNVLIACNKRQKAVVDAV